MSDGPQFRYAEGVGDHLADIGKEVVTLRARLAEANDCIAMIAGDVARMLGKEPGSVAPMFVPEHFAALIHERDHARTQLAAQHEPMVRARAALDEVLSDCHDCPFCGAYKPERANMGHAGGCIGRPLVAALDAALKERTT